MKQTTPQTELPEFKQRLNARKAYLTAKANGSEAAIRRNADYLVANAPEIIKEEVVDNVINTNPLVGRLLGNVLGVEIKEKKKPSSRPSSASRALLSGSSGVAKRDKSPLQSVRSAISTYVLPLLYTIGTSKLLSFSLRSSGTLIRKGIGRLFGRKKRKRRRK